MTSRGLGRWVFRGVLVALATCVVSFARPARACSPPIDAGVCASYCHVRVWPEDGALGVPLGTELSVVWWCPVFFGSSALPPSFRLRRVRDGAMLSLVSMPSGRFRVDGGLEPDSEYALEAVDRASGVCPDPATFVSIATFRTGTTFDTAPPPTPEPCLTFTACSYGACYDGACCGPWAYASRSVAWVDEPGALYEVVIDGTANFVNGGGMQFGSSNSGMFGYRPGGVTYPYGTIVVTAVDGSGNRSAPSAPLVVPRCPPAPDGGSFGEVTTCGRPIVYPDAGPDAGRLPDPLDAGVSSMDTPSLDAGSSARHASACSVAAGRTSAGRGPLAVLSLLFAAAFIRRRTRTPVPATLHG